MTSVITTPRGGPALRWQFVTDRSISGWAILAFCLATAVCWSPNLVQTIYGIHNDYEMLVWKTPGFLHSEAEALFGIARPVAALLTNLLMLPIDSLADYRWTRLFSLATLWFLGAQLMSICVHRLRLREWDAVMVALSTFLVLPFIYSVLNATAWSPHLLSILIAFAAYAILSGSNVLLPSFLGTLERRDYRLLLLQAWGYARLKPVWLACIVYQLAMYDYPSNALVLTLLPIVTVLFSRLPPAYRALVAARDILFVGASMVIFVVTAKLFYLPVVRLFTIHGTGAPVTEDTNPLVARILSTYRFDFNFDPAAAWHRVVDLLKVTGDLWFLPQLDAHVVVGLVVVLALILANVAALVARRRAEAAATTADEPVLSRLALEPRQLPSLVTLAVPVVCFVIAAAAIVASATGFVTYRTIAVPTAIVAVVTLFAVRAIVDAAWRMAGSPLVAPGRAGDAAMAVFAVAAIAANFYANDLTYRLARNEFSYFTAVVRQAVERNASTIVIVDPRPFAFPEDIPVVYDQKGRAVPPYELGCLSGYCLQTGAIVQIAVRELGYPQDKFRVYPTRDADPFPGLTCEMVTNPDAKPPPNIKQKLGMLDYIGKQDFGRRERDILNWFRSFGPVTCLTYTLEWHDVGIDLGQPGN